VLLSSNSAALGKHKLKRADPDVVWKDYACLG
jgi:hypothetical protein